VAPIYTVTSTHRGGAILLVCTVGASVAAAYRLFQEWYGSGEVLDEDLEHGSSDGAEVPTSVRASPRG
jgi:hypothetical protein